MIFSEGCQNGSHFSKWLPSKDKVMCTHISDYGGFLCAILALIDFQGQ